MVRGNAAAALLCAALASAANAQTIYSQNFESPVTVGSSTTGPGGFVQFNNIQGSSWQIQGGGGAAGVTLSAGVDNNGVGGSQALFGNWDHSPAAAGFFTFNQYTIYGIPGPGAGTPLSAIEVSMDILVRGSESSNTPLDINYQSGTDALYTPTLANNVYTHVAFTLDQTSSGIPDPSAGFNLRLQHGAGGFGFDSSNIVRVDNILVRVVPEPATLGLVPLAGLLLRRRR